MIWDILYILGRPLGYLADILDIKRLFQVKKASNRSLTAWTIAFAIPVVTLLRALLSVHDWVFTVNALIAAVLAGTILLGVIRWRKQ